MSPIWNTAALACELAGRLLVVGEVLRRGIPGAIVASGSSRAGPISTIVASSGEGIGTLLPELSPTNGVLMPPAADFLAGDFSSGRRRESSMRDSGTVPRWTKRKSLRRTHVPRDFVVREVYIGF